MICSLCGRLGAITSRHHLVPRARHKNRKARRDFTRPELNKTIDLCRPCHDHVHTVFSEKALEREYNTLEAISSHSSIIGHRSSVTNSKF